MNISLVGVVHLERHHRINFFGWFIERNQQTWRTRCQGSVNSGYRAKAQHVNQKCSKQTKYKDAHGTQAAPNQSQCLSVSLTNGQFDFYESLAKIVHFFHFTSLTI